MVQDWIRNFENLRYKSKSLYYQTVRSFFAHNRVELPRDKGFRIQGDKPPVVSKLRPEHIKKVILSSKPMYQALFLSMFEAAMGLQEVMYWNENGWPSLYEQLQANADVVKIDLPGRKKNRNKQSYYTLVGGDALRALKGYIGDDLDPNRKAIFLNVYGVPLKREGVNAYWRRTLIRLGIITPVKIDKQEHGGTVRYGYGLHELRDNFRTLWSRSTASSDIGEFLMGHSIDPLGYNQIYRDEEYAKEQYKMALPYLNIVSGDLKLEENQARARATFCFSRSSARSTMLNLPFSHVKPWVYRSSNQWADRPRGHSSPQRLFWQ